MVGPIFSEKQKKVFLDKHEAEVTALVNHPLHSREIKIDLIGRKTLPFLRSWINLRPSYFENVKSVLNDEKLNDEERIKKIGEIVFNLKSKKKR